MALTACGLLINAQGSDQGSIQDRGLAMTYGTSATRDYPRRTFFRWAIRGIATLIGLSLFIPIGGYVVKPALKRREAAWSDVGDIGDLRVGEAEELEYLGTVKDGWRTTTVKKAVWAVKPENGNVKVFSPICPHLGCGYRWDAEDKKFKCPCHGSVYDINGKVLGGPAPRPLDELPAKIEQGKLLVQYKEFKSGIDHQVEL
jgi:menaquinol-cytochrome c reductase iron-sulfur subunit